MPCVLGSVRARFSRLPAKSLANEPRTELCDKMGRRAVESGPLSAVAARWCWLHTGLRGNGVVVVGSHLSGPEENERRTAYGDRMHVLSGRVHMAARRADVMLLALPTREDGVGGLSRCLVGKRG